MVHDVLLLVHNVLEVFHDVLLCLTMFYDVERVEQRSASATTRPPIASGITIMPQKSAMTQLPCRDRRESDPMLNSVLNGDWSNSLPGRQIPKGRTLPSGIRLPGTGLAYSSLHSGWSIAGDHVRGDIDDPCTVIADFRGVIADPCGVVAIPEAIGGRAVADTATPIVARLAKHHTTLLNIVKHHETHVKHCDTS